MRRNNKGRVPVKRRRKIWVGWWVLFWSIFFTILILIIINVLTSTLVMTIRKHYVLNITTESESSLLAIHGRIEKLSIHQIELQNQITKLQRRTYYLERKVKDYEKR